MKSSFDRVVITQSSSPRAVEYTELAAIASKYFTQVDTAPNAKEAMILARGFQPDAIVVAGSISLAGDILKEIQLDDDYDDEHEDSGPGAEDGE